MTVVQHRRRIAHSRRKRRPGLARLWLILLAVVLAFVGVDRHMRPIIEQMTAYQAKIFSMRTINDAMAGELERTGVTYGDLITMTQGAGGEITSIQTDMMEVNRLKNRMMDAVIRELELAGNRSLRIPAGTLLGNQFTSGLGPSVTIQVIPSGYVQSEIYNQFTSAGINQTLHQVMLKVNVQMIAILPGYSVQTDTATNYCIAQTVIVGSVPEGFTEINGDDSSTISKFNDYKQHD